eukprot:TRINITY_DN8982_c0_g1_i5.p1 TRINITY_DN8982_c0_g1~~TRINITY_DN8982_c0_g1_i5.p1  ORF type:complete len:253 (+),score=46.72 TRINITY_DN8982_c0_g1_i5:102-860(+)
MTSEQALRIIKQSELSSHCTPNDGWIAIFDYTSDWIYVHNVTDYLNTHPGGAAMLIPFLGTDATSQFYNREENNGLKHRHGEAALNILAPMRIGVLETVKFSSPYLDHFSFATFSVNDVIPFFVDILGGSFYDPFYDEYSGFKGASWLYKTGRLEVIEPLGEESFLHRFLKREGPFLHHCCFKVPDLEKYATKAKDLGFFLVGYMGKGKCAFPSLLLVTFITLITPHYRHHHPQLNTTVSGSFQVVVLIIAQ